MSTGPHVRRQRRRLTDFSLTLVWTEADGSGRSIQGRVRDISRSGVRLECDHALQPGMEVHLSAEKYGLRGKGTVRYSVRRGASYHHGIEFADNAECSWSPLENFVDYYEVLQVSPNAESETIHRVFRIMAGRFHPDNPETGDNERFLLMRAAFDILSDDKKRAEYDAIRQLKQPEAEPIFELKEFVDDVQGEQNRRLGVLSLLYNQRRNKTDTPGLSILELEQTMSFPREHLEFTMWYLKGKHFVEMTDRSDYVLTADGVDYLEANLPSNRIVRRLIKGGTSSWRASDGPEMPGDVSGRAAVHHQFGPVSATQ